MITKHQILASFVKIRNGTRVCMIFLTESLLTVFCSISGAAIVCKILLFKRHNPDKMLHSIKSGLEFSSASVRRKFKQRQIENILSISLSDKP